MTNITSTCIICGRTTPGPDRPYCSFGCAAKDGVRQALTSQGFDVACGFLHADLKGRDSLVYDVMEPLRGMVDGLVLRFLSAHTLHYGDLTRVHDGSCRLHPQLARAVVAACKLPQETIAQQATWLREALLSAPGGDASAR